MKEYCTHLAFVSKREKLNRIVLPSRGAFFFINHGSTYESDSSSFCSTRNGSIFELWIEADSEKAAYCIADLLISAIAVIDFIPIIDLSDILHNLGYDDHALVKSPTSVVFGDEKLHMACKLVKRAVSVEKLEYAFYKYYATQEIYTIHPMDLQPNTDFIDRLYLPTIQTSISNAIIASFSIIEELGLKENASGDEPSRINHSWNPKVFGDLCSRLLKHGITPNEKLTWLSRGDFIRPFLPIIDSSRLCIWSDGKEIRDFEISIVEAILETSHIRSSKAAHGNRKKLGLLSIYDIENANALARTILLKYRA